MVLLRSGWHREAAAGDSHAGHCVKRSPDLDGIPASIMAEARVSYWSLDLLPLREGRSVSHVRQLCIDGEKQDLVNRDVSMAHGQLLFRDARAMTVYSFLHMPISAYA